MYKEVLAMRSIITWIVSTVMNRKEGATAVEYALIVAGIAVVIIIAVFTLGGQLNDAFKFISDQIGGATEG
jgi:pilus assembly protein Flp/PilA